MSCARFHHVICATEILSDCEGKVPQVNDACQYIMLPVFLTPLAKLRRPAKWYEHQQLPIYHWVFERKLVSHLRFVRKCGSMVHFFHLLLALDSRNANFGGKIEGNVIRST